MAVAVAAASAAPSLLSSTWKRGPPPGIATATIYLPRFNYRGNNTRGRPRSRVRLRASSPNDLGPESTSSSAPVVVVAGAGGKGPAKGAAGPWQWSLGFVSFFRRRPQWRRIFFASKKVRSIMMLYVLSVVYASTIPILKEVEVITDPALFNMVRFIISAIPFLPFMLRTRCDDHTRNNGIELGCWVSLGYISQALGMLTSDAGRASFLSAFTVILVPFIDGLLGATVPCLTWLGAIASLIGVGMLESSGSPPSVGDFLNLLSAAFFGIHMLRTEHISRITKKEKVFALLGYQVSVAALFSSMWYICGGLHGDAGQFSLQVWQWTRVWNEMVNFPWIPALYTGIFSTGICLWAEMSAMCDVSAAETAIIYGLEPLWGASFAWFLLGERWGLTGWIGAGLVLAGSLIVQIFGSTLHKSEKNQDASAQLHNLNVCNPIDLSLTPVIVDSTKSIRSLPKKRQGN